jgi:hypothetical protein
VSFCLALSLRESTVNRGKKTQGIALISVLFIAAVVLILASTFIFTIVRERQSTNASRLVSDSLQVADAISERARLTVVGTFNNAFKQAPDFVREVSAIINNLPSLSKDNGLKDKILLSKITDVNTVDINGKKGWWRVTGATPFNASGQPTESSWYITVSATAETANGVQTVIRRINMGQSQIFDLAMLARDTNCIYCHLRVNGDVGSLGATFQPGWDNSAGITSGADFGGSIVNGNLFLAGKAGTDSDTNLSLNPNRVNGAEFTGTIREDFNGEPLPQKNGVNAFPAIERNLGSTAKGSLSGGIIYTVDKGQTLSSVPTASNVTGGILKDAQYGKNVVLIGSKDNPIVLNGDIYFEGDVVIKGYVTGRGAIYSDRNVYVAGNVQYKNPANCKNASNKDACAQQAIRDKKDELRLGARGNIVLGDYTEVTDTGSPKTWQGLQAADYYRRQFGFTNATNTKCYDKATSDELEPVKDTAGTVTGYQNIEGRSVATIDMVCVPEKGEVNEDAYSYSMRPGTINTNSGKFESWLADGLYQDILETETRKYDVWRYDIDDRAAITASDIQKQFGSYGLSDTSLAKILSVIQTGGWQTFDVTDQTGNTIGRINWDGSRTIRVTIDEAFVYEKQVTRVDAFLYSNQRIAGKTFSAPLVINGGMISEEIGILAPGLSKMWYWNDPRYDFFASPTCSNSNAAFMENFVPGNPANPSQAQIEATNVFQPDSDDCALTVNYDHRLRNGGLGFNLVAADIGQTLSWQIADRKDQQVRP